MITTETENWVTKRTHQKAQNIRELRDERQPQTCKQERQKTSKEMITEHTQTQQGQNQSRAADHRFTAAQG